MLLLPDAAPLKRVVLDVIAEFGARGATIVSVEGYLEATTAVGAVGDQDTLDHPLDPAVDRARLCDALIAAHVPVAAAPVLADAIAQREDVLDTTPHAASTRDWRPPTLFEMAAMRDVLGNELTRWLPIDRVQIDRAPLRGRALNHCEMDRDGVAHVRLLDTNGTTLAGRTHALVHELGHALIGLARAAGTPYRAAYGQMDYGRFLDARTFDRPCDEEALVRAIADAWLLRRSSVSWARTWPGAVDAVARNLDGDDLAAFVRFRLAQGLGLDAAPVMVRRVR